MNVLDLFSGIGGFSLGLERAGMRTVAFCEIEPFCRQILQKRFPNVPCYGDIRDLTADILAADGITSIDLICGGFPCQDISLVGKGAGLSGARSGLWSEQARLIRELRPDVVVVENVAALLGRGLGDVLGDLAALGYDAEWHCIPASAVGAPHRRDRVWIVAHRSGSGLERHAGHGAPGGRQGQNGPTSESGLRGGELALWRWDDEPDVGRVAHGVPHRVDRLKALGNAIVPRIAELIGRAIMNAQLR
jgi:DNA (cytosine-5)-methyltransferase 1